MHINVYSDHKKHFKLLTFLFSFVGVSFIFGLTVFSLMKGFGAYPSSRAGPLHLQLQTLNFLPADNLQIRMLNQKQTPKPYHHFQY
mmetsp:Transcript_5195/g.6886  ORF Transcript_5195/g.6886 Transcript_5195/m.6886 type:complete len:86 (+) Transcript_5195:177-434(+)